MLAVQWLRLQASMSGVTGSIPGQGTKIPHAAQWQKFFLILFPYMLLQDIEHSSLCYTVGPWWLSILYRVVHVCSSQTLNSLLLVFFLR